MESTATVDSPEIAAPVATTPAAPAAPVAPAVKAPAYSGPQQARVDWQGLQDQLTRDGEMTLDMSALSELKRPAIAQIIRFLQRAEELNARVSMCDVPPKAHAMLEILGVHHLIEISPRDASRR